MTDKKPEALLLADALEDGSYLCEEAANELRRLHEVNAALVEALQYVVKQVPEFETVSGIAVALAKAEGK